MTVFPVTTTSAGLMLSASRLSRDRAVGARWSAEIWLVSFRLASSGKGLSRFPERSPASRWMTGMPRLKAAMEAPMTVVVSPWTSTASGASSSNTESSSPMTREAMPLRVCPWDMMLRSTSGTIPNRSLTWSSISRCWAVTTVRERRVALDSIARMRGATLIASGRVPKTVRTVGVTHELLVKRTTGTASARQGFSHQCRCG